MAKGAPKKKVLDYFPKMCNFYDDDKIMDLLEEYGPLGVTVYDCILTTVYSHGYYVETSIDKLSRKIVRDIGSKWVKKAVAEQVILSCADIGLIDDVLLNQGVITSVGIQRRYYEVAVRLMKRRLYSKKYWLLDENGNKIPQPLLNAPKNQHNSEENRFNSELNRDNSKKGDLIPTEGKERKGKERKGKEKKVYIRKPKPAKHRYGEYDNILLSDDELEKLKSEYPDYLERIERISAYVASTGKSYKSHYATIRNWAKREQDHNRNHPEYFQKQSTASMLDESYAMMAEWGKKDD